MTITVDDFEVFCRRSFAGVLRVVVDLGDELLNDKPALTNGNSPFVLVTHILGVCEWWVGHVLLGEPMVRVRDEEFTANGTIADLETEVAQWLGWLHAS